MQNLLDCKKEYIDIILDNTTVPICTLIYNIYKSSQNIQEFQNKMAHIENWNNHIIRENYDTIIKSCKNKYINKLLNEIIIINIKLKTENKKINMNNVKFINPEDFIHKCLINAGIYCWKNAYLFSHKNLKPSEKQYHLNIIEKNIRKIIKITIRDCTPIELILNNNNHDTEVLKKKYNLSNTKNDNEDEDEDDEDEYDEDDDEEEKNNKQEDIKPIDKKENDKIINNEKIEYKNNDDEDDEDDENDEDDEDDKKDETNNKDDENTEKKEIIKNADSEIKIIDTKNYLVQQQQYNKSFTSSSEEELNYSSEGS